MRRRLTVVLLAALAATTLVLAAVPAQATPAAYTQVGLRIGRAVNPNNPSQWVRWAVAANLGNINADSAKELVVGVGRVNEEGNTGVARWHITRIRVRQGNPGRVVNDYFPSANGAINSDPAIGPLNNTPGLTTFPPPSPFVVATPDDCADLATVGADRVLDLYDDRDPPGGCANEAAEIRNPLHNQRDYSPDVSLVRGFTDQIPTSTTTCPNLQVRLDFEVRYDDNTLKAYSVLSGIASSDSPGCP